MNNWLAAGPHCGLGGHVGRQHKATVSHRRRMQNVRGAQRQQPDTRPEETDCYVIVVAVARCCEHSLERYGTGGVSGEREGLPAGGVSIYLTRFLNCNCHLTIALLNDDNI